MRRMPLSDAMRTDARDVGGAPVDRREVELPVTRVEDHALRRMDRDREGVGHRVGDGNELDVERTDLHTIAVGVHRVERRAARRGRASSMRLRAMPSVSAEP